MTAANENMTLAAAADVEFGRRRVVIEGMKPEIDCGRFPIKRVIGAHVQVEVDAYVDGHDAVACVLRYRKEQKESWSEVPMEALVNDRWRARFVVAELGVYRYTVVAWVDKFETWRREFTKRANAGQDLRVPLLQGAELVRAAAARARGEDGARLKQLAEQLTSADGDAARRAALEPELGLLMNRYPDRNRATHYGKDLAVVVDRERAGFGAWYEFFPRSCTDDRSGHGRFVDCHARLQAIAAMGFDVVYLPPIHPIARTNRKGKNNTERAGPDDVGSPWAIGSHEGGHRAVHPQLGSLEDFRRLVENAGELGLEVALDLAFQSSPDHPYVQQHPEWFVKRPDGSIQYAENPPKKYQDIYPLHFETDAWRALWDELTDVALFWIGHGVRIFRVDNPHTKPFAFWEYLIGRIKARHPDVIFLAEAFTRPKVMQRLAKVGFTQSYTYFTWRNTKWELTQYLTELTQTEMREYFRPNLWPNTPDILSEYLQLGGRPAFMGRLVLAATLGSNYGIYGPAFELLENRPREPGSEEYLDAEKYQVRVWDVGRPDSLRDFITRVNRIRRENPALHSNDSLRFHYVDNEMLICYSKADVAGNNFILTVVNLDPHHAQSGWIDVPVDEFGLDMRTPYQAHDLLSGARYLWTGARNFVALDPHAAPAHIFRLRRRMRSEHDFDYYM